MFWKKVSRTSGHGLDRLAEPLEAGDLMALSPEELVRVEGGRARVSALIHESARRIPTDEVQIDLPAS